MITTKKQSNNRLEGEITNKLKGILTEGKTDAYWWWSYFSAQYVKPRVGIINPTETVVEAMKKIDDLIKKAESSIDQAENELAKVQNPVNKSEKQS